MSQTIALSGKTIDYKGLRVKIRGVGMRPDGSPSITLDPENDELEQRILAELKERAGFLKIEPGGTYRLTLGDDTFEIW